MNIVLIGYRGTGKSCVATIIAERTGRTVVDMDAEIVLRTGLSIPEFVAKEGWERFRRIETEVCRDLAARDNLVIATGGGVVTRSENVAALSAKGRLFWLKATPAVIVERIREDGQRPSLTGNKSFLEEVEEVLEDRTPLYRAAAQFEIETDNRSAEEVAAEVLARLDIPV